MLIIDCGTTNLRVFLIEDGQECLCARRDGGVFWWKCSHLSCIISSDRSKENDQRSETLYGDKDHPGL